MMINVSLCLEKIYANRQVCFDNLDLITLMDERLILKPRFKYHCLRSLTPDRSANCWFSQRSAKLHLLKFPGGWMFWGKACRQMKIGRSSVCLFFSISMKGAMAILLGLCLGAVFFHFAAAIVLADGDVPSLKKGDGVPPAPQPVGAASDSDLHLERSVDRTHEILSNSILATARWMDSFFYDERYFQEENKTRLKLRVSSFWELEEGVNLNIRANLRLVLPGFEDRLALVFSGDDEDEGIGLKSSDDLDIATLKSTDKEDTNVALRYIIKTVERRNISASLNFRWRDSNIVSVPGLRWRETFSLDLWELRFVQKIKWYSDLGWEEKTSFDFDRLTYRKNLFRTTLSGVWSEEDEASKGYSYNLDFSYSIPLSPNYAITYELKNNFQTKPTNRYQETIVRFRYRQKLLRDWIFLEMAPQIAFPRERDFDVTPGFLIFIEAIAGHYKMKRAK